MCGETEGAIQDTETETHQGADETGLPVDRQAPPAAGTDGADILPTDASGGENPVPIRADMSQPPVPSSVRIDRRIVAVLAGAGAVAAFALSVVLVAAIGRVVASGVAADTGTEGAGVIEGPVSEVEVGENGGSTKFELPAAEALHDGADDLAGTNLHGQVGESGKDANPPEEEETQKPAEKQGNDGSSEGQEGQPSPGEQPEASEPSPAPVSAASLADIVSMEMMRDNFVHGALPADKVRYIVMHDTESGTDSATAIASSWGDGHIAAHFVVGKDGTIIQCVPIGSIAHHAGNADYGQNDAYGIWPERDDEVGRTGSGDYAMNAWSIGIEIVHEHDDGAYPEAQLQALDRLVAAIDAAVGHQPRIIDHKAWAGSRKQDVSDDFPMGAYQRGRRHDA